MERILTHLEYSAFLQNQLYLSITAQIYCNKVTHFVHDCKHSVILKKAQIYCNKVTYLVQDRK